jgi:hypothetical protein
MLNLKLDINSEVLSVEPSLRVIISNADNPPRSLLEVNTPLTFSDSFLIGINTETEEVNTPLNLLGFLMLRELTKVRNNEPSASKVPTKTTIISRFAQTKAQ